MFLNVRWPCESLKRRLRKILLSPYLAKVKWLRIHPPMLSDQACTPRKAGLFAPVLWDVGGGDGSEGLNIYRIHAPAYNSYRFHSFPLLPCLNWRDSSRLVWIRWWSFHQAFDAATPCYADLLTLKGAVKFRTFLCSWHRIRGFRPKCRDIMKVKQIFKQKMIFRQPTGCIPWQRTPKVFCGKWLNFAVPSPGSPKSHVFLVIMAK